MKWSWQKWVGKLLPFVIAIGGAIWSLIEKEPQWWPILIGAATGIVQWLLATFPPKTT